MFYRYSFIRKLERGKPEGIRNCLIYSAEIKEATDKEPIRCRR
jgi:hypothetical protein